MADPDNPMSAASGTPPPKRRANDVEPAGAATADERDPETLYTEFRAGRVGLAELTAHLPLNIVFSWHTQRRISDQEFAGLMTHLEIDEVKVDDLPAGRSLSHHREVAPDNPVVTAFDARMAGFPLATPVDIVSPADMQSVFAASTPLPDGIGLRLAFARDEQGNPAPTRAPQLSLLCRAYIASTSMQSTVKCEAVFRGEGMDDLYCRIVVPLPIHKGGRRRLLVSVRDNQTRQPINLPPPLAEIFHERFLVDLKLLRKEETAAGGLAATIKSYFDRLFKR